MRKFIRILLFVVILIVGFGAFLLKDDLDVVVSEPDKIGQLLPMRIENFFFTQVPRPARLLAFQNLSSLLPIGPSCQSSVPVNGDSTVIPGDSLTGGEGDITLTCEDGTQLTVKQGSSATFFVKNGQIAPKLQQGSIEIRFSGATPAIDTETAGISILAPSESGTHLIVSTGGPQGLLIGCMKGNSSINIIYKNGIPPGIALAHDCRFSLKGEDMPEKFLMPGDAVLFADLEKNRKDWAQQDLAAVLPAMGVNASEYQPMNAQLYPSGENLRLAWASNAQPGQYDCSLFAQDSARNKPQNVYRFQGDASRSELNLQRGFEKFWVSLTCVGENATVVSNVIGPQAQ